ncbi:agamous MADS-box protein [Salix suchowensis]|nr:agamous MADS-box protein [Salix suchowensis]
MAAKVKKQSLGRQKIEIKKIENKSSLEVTFTKRRHGLFNKACEIGVLTGAEAAVIAFSPGKKAFAFGYPSVDTVIERYLSENTREGGWVINTSTSTGHDHRAVQESRREYEEALAKKEEETKRVEMLKEGGEVGFGSDRFWWDRSIQGMGLEELEQYVASMEELKKNVGIRVDELEKASNSPSRFLDLDSGVHAIENFSTN